MFEDVLNDVYEAAGSPPFARPYCTVQDLIDECRVKQPDDLDAPTVRKFVAAINLATGQIESYCKRDFWYHDSSSTPLTVLPAWVAGGEIFLPYPILSLTGISQSSIPMTSDQWISESTGNFSRIRRNLQSDFNLLRAGFGEYGNSGYDESNRGIMSAYSGFDSYWRYLAHYSQLTLAGTFGFPLAVDEDSNPDDQQPPPTLPGAVRRAATLIAAAWSGENRKEFYSAMNGETSRVLDENMPKEAAMILRPFVYRVV